MSQHDSEEAVLQHSPLAILVAGFPLYVRALLNDGERARASYVILNAVALFAISVIVIGKNPEYSTGLLTAFAVVWLFENTATYAALKLTA